MMDAPSAVDPKQLEELSLKTDVREDADPKGSDS